MRIHELEITNVRGIRKLQLKPEGKNFVVWGPNGSGKSAVVDAIDFLLTGRISRLMGRGTAGISLSKHGPHIDCPPDQAIVRAKVMLPGGTKLIEISRCMATPKVIEIEGNVTGPLEPILELAARGQHVLTRREILKYVTAESKTRAEEIQELLNISDLESVRTALVRTRNDLEKEAKAASRTVKTEEAKVNVTASLTDFSFDAVLEVVNQNRAVLQGYPIDSITSDALQKDINPPASRPQHSINTTLLSDDIGKLVALLTEESQNELITRVEQFNRLIDNIRSDSEQLRTLSQRDLVKLGIDLLDENGNCPLCDTPWPPGKLHEHLSEKLSSAESVAAIQRKVNDGASEISRNVRACLALVDKAKTAAEQMKLAEETKTLNAWIQRLNELNIALSEPIAKFDAGKYSSKDIASLSAPADGILTARRILAEAQQRYPSATPEQTTWDTLTTLKANLKGLEDARKRLLDAETHFRWAVLLHDNFITARDGVLGALYDEICERFEKLYRTLHGPDEDHFTARIGPDGAGLTFEVDFYDRGKHPPHALHSEGHQDSMGLCLYLTLVERLNQDIIQLVLLDDVVMSVDSEHRRQLCTLLAKNFPDRQFLITTHDRTWANQLKSEGVVTVKDSYEFRNWSIETGPTVYFFADQMWDRINATMADEDINSAAAQLRRGSEEYFSLVCDALQVPVRFRLSGSWELGDLLIPAMEKYRDLLKEARKAANSWNNQDEVEQIDELDSVRSMIYQRTFAEQWAVNPNVHYSSWASFTVSDFQPVVEAFQDLYRLFICSQCGGFLQLTVTQFDAERKLTGIRCKCNNFNLNLVKKS